MSGVYNVDIITNFRELVGKEIAFAHFPQFSNKQIIVTKDNCVFISKVILDEDEWDSNGYLAQMQRVLYPKQVINFLDSDEGKYIREKLIELGIFNFEEYKERQKKELEYKLAKLRLEKENENLQSMND